MKKKIAILTNFQDFNPGYSLTGIVCDQVEMLERHGNDVTVYVNERFNPKHLMASGKRITFKKEVPFGHLKDYKSKGEISVDGQKHSDAIAAFLLGSMPDYDIVFTHDWIFTGWNLPYALALQATARHTALEEVRWFHWIHSVPSNMRDWWQMRAYGPKQKMVFPNETDRMRVAEEFRTDSSSVVAIPHIKDLRTWFDFHEDTCGIIDDMPSIMQADIVCVYPASTDRLSAKKLDKVILIMAIIQNMGYTVSLVCANQWATGKQRKEDVGHYYRIASRNGLKQFDQFMFTSSYGDNKYETGIPKRMLRELLLCANLFIFPTAEESFGLISPEAGLSGAKLMVLNKSLAMMTEVNGLAGIYVDFGSYHNIHNVEDEKSYFEGVAHIILGRMRENDAIQSSTFYRQQYNMDRLYNRVYAPAMADSELW